MHQMLQLGQEFSFILKLTRLQLAKQPNHVIEPQSRIVAGKLPVRAIDGQLCFHDANNGHDPNLRSPYRSKHSTTKASALFCQRLFSSFRLGFVLKGVGPGLDPDSCKALFIKQLSTRSGQCVTISLTATPWIAKSSLCLVYRHTLRTRHSLP